MPFWAACRVFASREREALRHLARAGVTAWSPQVSELRVVRGHRGRQRVLSPLFPGYLFASVVELPCPALWLPGVLRPLRDGSSEQPARVADRIIDELRGRERDGAVALGPPPPRLTSGDRVRVTGGPFAGALGEVAALLHDRAVVLLERFGRANVPVNDIEMTGAKGQQFRRSQRNAAVRLAVDALRARLDELDPPMTDAVVKA